MNIAHLVLKYSQLILREFASILTFLTYTFYLGAVVVVIVYIDLQLLVQLLPITTNVTCVRIHLRRGIPDITLCDQVCQ